MRARKLNIFRTLVNLRRSREWGRGTTGVGTSCAGNTKPNHVGATTPQQGSAYPYRATAGSPGRNIYVKNQPFPNPRSRSDEFRGLGKGPADSAESPIPRPTEDAAPRSSVAGALGRTRKRGAVVCVAIAMGLLLVAAPQALALTPTTGFATRSDTLATLNGEVNPEGVQVTECFFEYGETTSYGNTASCVVDGGGEIGSGTSAVPVQAELTGLTLGHRYHYRLIAANAAPETKEGSDQAFTAGASHTFSTSFTGPESAPLSSPDTVAVDESTGDVYVSDPANYRVEKFTPAGEFILMFGMEVNKNGSDVCTAAEECQPGTPGSTPGAFARFFPTEYSGLGSNLYLAVDNSHGPSAGDVYVGDSADALVSKFDSEGHLIATWGHEGQLDGVGDPGGRFGLPLPLQGIAVKPEGTLIVAGGDGHFYEFAPDGSFLDAAYAGGHSEAFSGIAADAGGNVYEVNFVEAVNAISLVLLPGTLDIHQPEQIGIDESTSDGPFDSPLAIDPSTRNLYVLDGAQVRELLPTCWESTCTPIDTFGAGQLNSPRGLAVNAATGSVYVADAGDHRVAVFTANPYLPAATPTAATAVTATAATLHATVDPAGAGPITGCKVQYGPEPTDERQTLTIGATGTADLTAGSREVTGLTTSIGAFLPGETIEVPGAIPAGTVISAAPAGRLVLSAPATTTATAVPLAAKPSGGSYTLTFEGHTTGPIPYNATDGKLQQAITSVLGHNTSLGVEVAATVGGSPGGPYRVEFIGSLADTNVPQITADPSGLTPSGATITPATATQGQAGWTAATTTSCEPQALPYSESEFTAVTAQAPALAYATTYRFRLLAENSNGTDTSFSETFTTLPHAPVVGAESVAKAYADAAQIDAQVDPGGGDTAYRVEYVTQEHFEEEEFAHAEESPDLDAGSAKTPQALSAQLTGLAPATVYHYRVFASNECEAGVQCKAEGEAHTFTTLPSGIPTNDPCPNAHVRQQTSAAQLLDCRAYELVSAPHTAGYDVESNLIEGQAPFAGYPQAKTPSGEPKLLYGIHDGGVPGIGAPTNHGVDPYVATRTPEGWSTEYVGLPAAGIPSTAPFGSPLLAADQDLDTFAFGGSGLCAPCFSTGIETGIPLHSPGAEKPVQGMAGPEEPAPSAKSDGYVAEPLSANGSHLIFGSTSAFVEGANDNDGNVSIYDRDLKTGETHVVSKGPEGANLKCLQGSAACHSPGDPDGIAELAISSDGSHILLAQKASADADNVYWRLFMDVDDSEETIELIPKSAKKGVLFDGMTENGSTVFFSSEEHLTAEDTSHTGADIFMWSQKGEEEGTPLSLISTGDTASCDPVSNSNGPHWNTVGSAENCGAVAIGGGGGVASESGAIYFLSPETLEAGHGALNQPNLYLAAPGQSPRFIATLEPDNPLVLDSVKESGARHTADFQLTPSGAFAAFPSTLALAGHEEETAGHTVLYRYDASTETLACLSCTLTGLPSEGDSSLASDGLSLTDDGRVFFNSDAPLVATDTDERADVYQWEPEGAGNCIVKSPSYSNATKSCLALISAGTSAFDSGLLSTDASGKDAYFFTRDSLVPQDENGPTVKVYDAREGGGFPYSPPRADCKASDECHGAASPPPPPIEAGSEAGTPHNAEEEPKAKTCKKGFVLKHGKCVKKSKSHKHHKRANHKRGGKK